jgi:hypothetical protein
VLLLQIKDDEIEHLRQELLIAHEAVPETTEPVITMSNQPLYLSESQEDIQFQYDHDMIDMKQYEALLKELEFENSEIQFDDELSVENFHY